MPMALEPPPTQAQMRPDDRCRTILQLLLGLFADDLLEITHHGGEGVWSCNGAEQIMRVLDVGDPVAQRLIDGILENYGRPT